MSLIYSSHVLLLLNCLKLARSFDKARKFPQQLFVLATRITGQSWRLIILFNYIKIYFFLCRVINSCDFIYKSHISKMSSIYVYIKFLIVVIIFIKLFNTAIMFIKLYFLDNYKPISYFTLYNHLSILSKIYYIILH